MFKEIGEIAGLLGKLSGNKDVSELDRVYVELLVERADISYVGTPISRVHLFKINSEISKVKAMIKMLEGLSDLETSLQLDADEWIVEFDNINP